MADDRDVPSLANVPLFARVAPADLAEISRRMRPRRFRRGDAIVHRGDPAGALHFIRDGRVKVWLPSEEGDETVLGFLGPGSMFGEIAALDGNPRSATVTAIEPTETLSLGREELLAFAHGHPEVALALIQALAAMVRAMNEVLEDAYFLDLDTRLARRLIALAKVHGRATSDGIDVALPLTQSDLAGMLGVTRVSVNRLLAVYQDEGLVRLAKGRHGLTILSLDALRRRAAEP